jgi:hypothetical protein
MSAITPSLGSVLNPGRRSLFIFIGIALAVILWSFLVGYGASIRAYYHCGVTQMV